MYQAGLVLEGGAMKGVYTAGVLDFFLDKEIAFSSCYGVSAGACNLCSFLSKQRKRAYRVTVDYLDNKHYCGAYSLLTTGDLFGADVCYDMIPNYLDPYDYDAFNQYEGKAYAVATNIETGKAEYLPIRDMKKDIVAVRASSSMPLVSRKVEMDGKLYLDGGISDSVPIGKAIEDGNRKNVVVLTKEVGFRREAVSPSRLAMLKARYLRYPQVYELMKERHVNYNAMLDRLDRQAEEGKAFVIRPRKKSGVGRIERDAGKLKALYEEGYRDAEDCYMDLLEYLAD